jgi:hypothetical protein
MNFDEYKEEVVEDFFFEKSTALNVSLVILTP